MNLMVVQLNYAIYHLSIINYSIYIYAGSMYLWPVQFNRSKTIEPAVQPVLNGWTSEPVNRRLRRFDLRSGPNNLGLEGKKVGTWGWFEGKRGRINRRPLRFAALPKRCSSSSNPPGPTRGWFWLRICLGEAQADLFGFCLITDLTQYNCQMLLDRRNSIHKG